jgi:DNA-binding LacI/PurR family transcriptional regulator/DNA-binding transcriptional regulator YhcF (GntR family)
VQESAPNYAAMFLPASQRLFRALLFEMASGNYHPDQRFLSHRLIMRNWRVSATTANLALALLAHFNLVRVADRSGHYLVPDFREKALALLGKDNQELNPTPIVKGRDLRGRLIGTKGTESMNTMRIGVLLLTTAALPKNNPRTPARMALDVAAASTARGIYVLAEESNNQIDFVACRSTEEDKAFASNRLSRTAPDGVVVVCRIPNHQIAMTAEALLTKLIPVVAIFDDCEGTEMISVNFNNIGMGVKAAEVFMDSGHRRLGILLPKHFRGNADRQQGFQRTVKERIGITATEFFIDPNESPEEQYAAARSIRNSEVTALYSIGHELTASLHPCLAHIGIEIPKDLSILSSSSTPDIPGTNEKVDVLHMDFEALGKIAYRALTDYRRGEVSQKCYLVNPPHHAHGTVQVLVG